MKMFYNKRINIIGITDGYIDDLGIYHAGTESIAKTINCDVQPATEKLAYYVFGYTKPCSYRIFANPDGLLKIGTKIKYKNEEYEIVQMVEWENYYDILVNNAGGGSNDN